MLDITPALNVMKGVALELEDCSFPLLKSVPISLFRSPSVIKPKSSSKMLMLLSSLVVNLVSREWREKIFYN